ncbi:PREDICTED: UPF0575 protein C19orf67 homolog isoform X1 [Poecilia mexicana]|uniref:UPF0575 protein C19orf67 homolog isoform X1 n=1 Tax=Poecilia mexicana TaxID=48701 RepID=UPI00072EA6A3|nr:PREDICTED: UPF0575 protein C19orf67 homolog isoform X1 [Poecilia mexicana]
MMDSEDELVVLTDISSPSLDAFKDLLREDGGGEAPEITEGHQNPELREDEPLALLADVALAPSCGRSVSCSCPEVSGVTGNLHSIQLQLQFFLSRVDNLQDSLVSGNSHLDREALAAAVSSLLYTCQPYFNHLESTGRSTVSLCAHKPSEFCSKLCGLKSVVSEGNTLTLQRRSFCLQLLSFSQQLCDRLEQLLLTYASYDLISLDESEPNSISHFCVGQVQLGQMKVTTFRYCKPTPYLSRVDTGVYKRMRWNVQRFQEDHRRGEDSEEEEEEEREEEEEEEGEIQTDYYFLCYEDILNTHADPDSENEDASNDNVVRMWSIGQWVQVKPERTTDDIYDWILCEVPEASYRRLLFLGRNEPSSCTATDYLQQLLLTCHAD